MTEAEKQECREFAERLWHELVPPPKPHCPLLSIYGDLALLSWEGQAEQAAIDAQVERILRLPEDGHEHVAD